MLVVLYHAGKIEERQTDGRMALRSSSAIYGAAALVRVHGEHERPKGVIHQRNAPDARDGIADHLFLTAEVPRPDSEKSAPGASRIVYRGLEDVEGERSPEEQM